MDDFGTGYSSLGYLRQFPFDKLKIDQSFIRDLEPNGSCLEIIRAIVQLAKALGIRVVVEGVENLKQLALLKCEGCDEYQGYYFSKPAPAEEVQKFINTPIVAHETATLV